MRLPWTAGLLAAGLLGCTPEKQPKPVESCTRAGDSCVFAPGKLGICVESVNGSPRFLCQSQH